LDPREAEALIRDAVGESAGVWADFGAGTGTFTAALRTLLSPESRIYAFDNDSSAITTLQELGPGVMPVRGDFTKPFDLPEAPLDGILFANALHFVRDQGSVLGRLVKLLRPGGRVVIVEYDRRAASRWVPYPVDAGAWPSLAQTVGLVNPRITARTPSVYAGDLYVGVAEKTSR
jgi:trans-aconitate methyltransferase